MLRIIAGLIPGFFVLACGDGTPPHVVSITPADGASDVWLHDIIHVTFSEPIEPASLTGVQLVGAAGEPIATTAMLTSETELAIAADPSMRASGDVRLLLSSQITDLAGNKLTETSASWSLAPWVRNEIAGAILPAIAARGTRLVMARNIVAETSRRVVVSEWSGSTWIDLGEPLGVTAAVPSVAFTDSGDPLVVWTEFSDATPTIGAARWTGTWEMLPSPGPGAYATAASPPTGEPLVAFMTDSVIRVRQLDGATWRPLSDSADVTINGELAALPQLAAAAPAKPVLVFAERNATTTARTQVRIAQWTGTWIETASIPLHAVPPGAFNRLAIAARGDEVVVAYDDFDGSFGVHAVLVAADAWKPLGGAADVDPASDASMPAVAIDADGTPVLAWREEIDGNWRGVVARWTGASWTGGFAWNDDPTREIVRPTLALAADRVPVVAWHEATAMTPTVRVSRLNGPAAPSLPARASISGCTLSAGTTTLAATGCFTIADGRATPHPGLIPFDVNSELWSDGALKRRWIALPDGATLTTRDVGAWDAPLGTMMIKEFAVETTPGDPRTRRAMETRFLVRNGEGWQGFSFRWRLDGSDADLLPDVASTFAWPLEGGKTHVHSYPSRVECQRCHHPSNGPLLGLRTAQLVRRLDYDGMIMDQLDALAALGAIAPATRVPPMSSPHDTSLPLETRVRGYLAANCSHCHNPTGERATRDFRWETPLAQTMLCGSDFEVVAGDPAASVIVQRISTRVGGMPPLATLQTDPLAIDVVSRWIATETNCP